MEGQRGARREGHLRLRCASQPIVHGTVGVAVKYHPSAVLFTAVKGAYDLSVKSSSFFLCVCCATPLFARQHRVVRTHVFPIAGRGGGGLPHGGRGSQDFQSYLYIRELTGGNGRSRRPRLARATDSVPLQGCC